MRFFDSRAYRTLPVLAAVLVAGCETMSKEECLNADWYQAGYQAGRDGRDRAHIESVAKSCAKAGVTPDRKLYFDGRERGLQEYCSPGHAFSLGVNGSYYNAVCPPDSAIMFESYYNEGRRIFDAQQYVYKLEEESNRLEHLLSEAHSDDEKRKYRDTLEVLDDRLRSARNKLRFIENESRLNYSAP